VIAPFAFHQRHTLFGAKVDNRFGLAGKNRFLGKGRALIITDTTAIIKTARAKKTTISINISAGFI